MSQITESKIDGIVVTRRVITDTCKRIWTAANEAISRLNDSADITMQIKILENQLSTNSKSNEISFEMIQNQISTVKDVIEKTSFIDLSTQDQKLLQNALIIKHTDIKDHIDYPEINSLLIADSVKTEEVQWDKLMSKVKENMFETQIDHAFRAFKEACKRLSYVEVEKDISTDGEYYLKATNKANQAATMIILPENNGLNCKIDLAGFNPETKDCQNVQRRILSGLKKRGVLISDIRLFTHNNPEGIIKIKEKSKFSKMVDFVTGKIKKSNCDKIGTLPSHQTIKIN
jgi:hypothetical protein